MNSFSRFLILVTVATLLVACQTPPPKTTQAPAAAPLKPALSPQNIADLNREVARAAPPDSSDRTKRIEEKIRARFNLKSERDIGAPMVSQAQERIDALREGGLLQDDIFARNLDDDLASVRVVGPSEPDAAHPDCVAVGSGRNSFCCTGTLIAARLVITAGHCFASGCSRYVLFGDRTNDRNRKVVAVRKAIRHQGYLREADPNYPAYTRVKNDLTLLVLDRPAPSWAQPRAIATTAQIDSATNAWIVGFGTTEFTGRSGYGERRVAGPAFFADPTNPVFGAYGATEFVLGAHPEAIDSCKGDSGGPIYIVEGQLEFVAGATSRGLQGARQTCGGGGIYVRLDKYLDWIREEAGKAGVEFPQN